MFQRVLIALLPLTLAACALPTFRLPQPATPVTELPVAPAEVRDATASAQEYLQRAARYPWPQRAGYELVAAELWLRGNRVAEAEAILRDLAARKLPPLYHARAQFLNARLAMARQRPEEALRLLDALPEGADLQTREEAAKLRTQLPDASRRATLEPAPPAMPARYRQIALLLPLSSPHARAASAVRDGFLAMHRADPELDRPIVKLYDTGVNDEGVRAVYETAQREGAEFIVGPLGRRAVTTLVGGGTLTTPTLLLGIPPTPPAQPNIFQFALDPEQDARQAAEHLYFRGHRMVATLTPASETGRRVAEAFRRHFEEIGGIVAVSAAYGEHGGDHAQTIKSLLDLTASEQRKARLASALRVPIEFAPRRRQDLDALFLHGGPAQARLIRPQLGYYQAHDLPVYGTPQVYTGRPDPIADGDLEGLRFGDMPWLLAQDARVLSARERIQGDWPYRYSDLDRLYALGMDAYLLPASLPRLAAEPAAWLDGMTAELGLDANRIVTRRLTWARFDRGRAVLEDAPKP